MTRVAEHFDNSAVAAVDKWSAWFHAAVLSSAARIAGDDGRDTATADDIQEAAYIVTALDVLTKTDSCDTSGWRPGPPPLDRDGRYDCLIGNSSGRGTMTVRCGHCFIDGHASAINPADLDVIRQHYPIPEPSHEPE